MSTVAAFSVNNEPLEQEFDKLFREHYSLIFNTAFSVTGSPEDAEDVAQTIFMRMYRRGIPPSLTQNTKGYLYRAAVNEALTTIRSRRRHILTGDDKTLETAAETRRPQARPDIEERLVEAIAQLNPGAVELLILRYEHNYSDAEIGTLLGKSRAVVAVSLFRARAKLKKLLRASRGENR